MNKRQPSHPPFQADGLSRRHFIRGLALLPGALGGSFLLQGCSDRSTEIGSDGRPLLALSAAQARTLQAVADAVVPGGPGFPDARTTQIVRRFDEELSFVSPSIQADLRAALGVLEFIPGAFGHFSRFSRLDLTDARAVLQAMDNSRSELLRAIGANVQLLSRFFYFAHPATWAATGYDGPFGHMPQKMSAQRLAYAARTRGEQA